MASPSGSFRIASLRQLQLRYDGVRSVVPMATTKKSTARITLKTVIEHMDRKFQLVDARFEAIDKRFEAIDRRFDGVDARFESLEMKIDGVERRLTRQIDGLDKRLDDIEINVIPALKKAVGAR
jgi:chaperonin cofactor prefoldin